jgi:hypothetical protein
MGAIGIYQQLPLKEQLLRSPGAKVMRELLQGALLAM